MGAYSYNASFAAAGRFPMTVVQENKSPESVQASLQQVQALLGQQPFAEPKNRSAAKRHLGELQTLLDTLHPADVAYILEALPREQRLIVWELVKAERDGEILLEVSDAVRETLIAHMDSDELLAAAETLDTDEIADLAPDLPQDVIEELLQSLDAQNRARLQSAMSFDEDTVGALMDYDMVSVRDDVTLEVVLRYLRRLGELPDQTDKLFVVDQQDHLKGVLPLKRLLTLDPSATVRTVMVDDVVLFEPGDEAREAAQAFERYDLVTAPVIDAEHHLIGRLTVDVVMDYLRDSAESEKLGLAGLREEEDLFASVWKSVQNRWAWLAINLVTAFIASRVIGLFEGSIQKLVALAALMPIVAGIGGNSGNQTITMIVRALALGQLHTTGARKLIFKELGVAGLNGLIWGSVMGVIAYLLYKNIFLGLVITSAMILNLLLAAVVGVLIPLFMVKMGRDPAVGSSVLITAITDSGGFFIFLGLATLFLV
jgi:magnesium transporter